MRIKSKKALIRHGKGPAAIFLSLLMVYLSAIPVFALTKKVTETRIAYNASPLTLEMWHYSGGYWKIGNDASTAATITDAQIGRAVNIGSALSSRLVLIKPYNFNSAVKSRIQTGDRVIHKISANGTPLYKLFDTSSFSGTYSGSSYSVAYKPIFNISSLRTMDDYVAGMSVTVPLVDIAYGENHYSLYKGSSNSGDGRGYYKDSSAFNYPGGEIHPSMISDSSGKFKSGFLINNQISTFQSSGYYVGNSTFKNGGAVGLKFIFPLKIDFYVVHTEWVEDKVPDSKTEEVAEPGDDDDGDNSGSGSSENQDAFSLSDWNLHRLR